MKEALPVIDVQNEYFTYTFQIVPYVIAIQRLSIIFKIGRAHV